MMQAQSLNPLILAIVRHKLKAVAEEMVETMTHTCFSPILNQNQDFSAVILDARFQTIAQAERVPIHMGAIPLAVELMAEAFASDLLPGDVLMANDPYWGGSHLPDITLAMPFFNGPDIWFWIALRAHQGDIGGMAAGGYAADAREIWQEGLRIPPMRLVEQTTLRKDVLRLVAENTRRPGDISGDLMAQLAAVNIGAQRLEELFNRYEPEDISTAVGAILDGGEDIMRAILRECVPGHHSGLSHMEYAGAEDGLLPIPVDILIENGHAIVDLTAAPDQVQAFINSSLANTRAAVLVAFLYFVGNDEGLNDGSARAIEIRTRKGSLLDPTLPAPVGACTSSTACAVIEAVLHALQGADPKRAIGGFARRFRFALSGTDASGAPFIWHYFFNKGGTGANLGHDGWSNIGGLHNPGGTPSPSIERTEASYALTVEEYSLLADSGGAGRWRGGLGGLLVLRYDGSNTGVLNASGEGVEVRPYGVDDGYAGPGHDYAIHTPDHIAHKIGVHDSAIEIQPGSRIICHSAGGGGFGAPHDRDRALVSRDIEYGYVTPKAARDLYGYEG